MTPQFLGIAVGLALLAALLVGVPLWRAQGSRGGLLTLVAIAMVTPLAVLSLYTQVSSYPWDKPERLTSPPPGSPEQISQMVEQLAERMAQEPDAEGLTMLGRSYTVMQRFDEAAAAYQQAWEMTGGEVAGITLNYAEALILADRNSLAGTAGDLLDEVLVELPNDSKALWYGGLSALARGNAALGQQRWARLLNQPDIPDQLRQVVQQQLAAMNDDDATVTDNMAASGESSQNEITGPVISITVSVAANLNNDLTGQETLYVFAREAGRPGPPVAVKRISAPVFPLQVNIDDTDVMLEGSSLATVQKLELTARLSQTGNAIAATGDLFGAVTPDWPADNLDTSITIDQTVP